ncbi:MAG: protein-L-isoaspartate(D-aspartate) O-methyltransferase [Rhodospirillales bacterium]|nr:protein-L-isoaspartate(D-aspartate) O-methyltransferase [Rhodospirillales bacterium]
MALFAPGNDKRQAKLAKARARLLAEIQANAEETRSWTGRAKFSDRVMAAITKVPREDFMQPGDQVAAYVNRPQAIGFGQTISQPFIVALMTDLLDLKPTDRVLEIGTGSGYQAAVLAELAEQVKSVERVEALALAARERLDRMGYGNVEVRTGDGFLGWPDGGQFDAIIVTAAPEHVPPALIQQLRPGGRMVIPIGRVHATQSLVRVTKDKDGRIREEATLPVAFVPMLPAKAD